MIETSKITRAGCCDCKKRMMVLSNQAAVVIQVRCPDCTEEFGRKVRKYNRAIGYKYQKRGK